MCMWGGLLGARRRANGACAASSGGRPSFACLQPCKHTSFPPAIDWGRHLRITACHPATPGPHCQAFYHRQKSRWTPWQDEARQAELEAEYQHRLAVNHTAGWAPDPRDAAGELLALCRHHEQPISTVRQVCLARSDVGILCV